MARRHVLAVAGLLVVAALACSADASRSSPPDEAPSSDVPSSDEADVPEAGGDGDCPEPGDAARPWEDGPSVELVTLADGAAGPRVRAAVYPRPDYEGNPWSQWGQGIVLADGRFLSAIGDHIGRDGNSFLYELDPADGRLTRIGDIASLVGHRPGDWGYGKVHAQMVAGPCGEVYAASYWGTRNDLAVGGSYEGDVLLRLDPQLRTSESLGPILEGHGAPSMAGWADGGLLYAEAADPQRFDPRPRCVRRHRHGDRPGGLRHRRRGGPPRVPGDGGRQRGPGALLAHPGPAGSVGPGVGPGRGDRSRVARRLPPRRDTPGARRHGLPRHPAAGRAVRPGSRRHPARAGRGPGVHRVPGDGARRQPALVRP